MQQRETMHDAICADNHVYGLSRCDSLNSQFAEVLSRLYRDVPASKSPYLDSVKKFKGNPIVFLLPESLQDFGKYKIARKNKLFA